MTMLTSQQMTAFKSRRGEVADRLAGKYVGLFGAGSVGSTLGLLLAQAGVGRFRIVDRDRLDAANLSRHACDLADLGHPKAEAVAELLTRRLARAEAREVDLAALEDQALGDLVDGLDLVAASTDSPAVQFLMNEACLRTRTPGIFVGAYERACGGEVILVRPGAGPCFYCAVGFRAGVVPDLVTRERREAYQAADADQLTAEPGLAADLAFLAAVAAASCLAVLDPSGSRGVLLDPGRTLTLVHGGSTPRGSFAELFRRPFEVIRARVLREESCPVCGWKTPVEAHHGA